MAHVPSLAVDHIPDDNGPPLEAYLSLFSTIFHLTFRLYEFKFIQIMQFRQLPFDLDNVYNSHRKVRNTVYYLVPGDQS